MVEEDTTASSPDAEDDDSDFEGTAEDRGSKRSQRADSSLRFSGVIDVGDEKISLADNGESLGKPVAVDRRKVNIYAWEDEKLQQTRVVLRKQKQACAILVRFLRNSIVLLQYYRAERAPIAEDLEDTGRRRIEELEAMERWKQEELLQAPLELQAEADEVFKKWAANQQEMTMLKIAVRKEQDERLTMKEEMKRIKVKDKELKASTEKILTEDMPPLQEETKVMEEENDELQMLAECFVTSLNDRKRVINNLYIKADLQKRLRGVITKHTDLIIEYLREAFKGASVAESRVFDLVFKKRRKVSRIAGDGIYPDEEDDDSDEDEEDEEEEEEEKKTTSGVEQGTISIPTESPAAGGDKTEKKGSSSRRKTDESKGSQGSKETQSKKSKKLADTRGAPDMNWGKSQRHRRKHDMKKGKSQMGGGLGFLIEEKQEPVKKEDSKKNIAEGSKKKKGMMPDFNWGGRRAQSKRIGGRREKNRGKEKKDDTQENAREGGRVMNWALFKRTLSKG